MTSRRSDSESGAEQAVPPDQAAPGAPVWFPPAPSPPPSPPAAPLPPAEPPVAQPQIAAPSPAAPPTAAPTTTALLSKVAMFQAEVDALLPGRYVWLAPASLHVTLRAADAV